MKDIEKLLQDLGESTKKVTMTPLEKNRHRAELQHFMEKAANVPALHADPSRNSHPFASLLRKMNPVYIAVPLILAAGVGVVYAAQGSLPGDLLYGLKTNVIEKVQTSLSFSPENKATLDAQLAIRRLQEGEAVVQKDSMDDSKKNQLNKEFEDQQQQLMADINELKKEQKIDVANKISADFSQKLLDHQKIFNTLTDHLPPQNNDGENSTKSSANTQHAQPEKTSTNQKNSAENGIRNWGLNSSTSNSETQMSLPFWGTKFRSTADTETWTAPSSDNGSFQPQISTSNTEYIKVNGGD